MKIVRLAVRNFLGISDFETPLSPGVNVVKGANGSGKSSVLKALWRAIKGGRNDAPWVIHRLRHGFIYNGEGAESASDSVQGEKVAEILVELDGSYKVRRRIAERGSTLQVTKREGPLDVEVRSPQAWLDSLVGPVFQAVEFFKAPAAERRRILLSAVPATLNGEDVNRILLAHQVPSAINILPESIGLAELAEIEASLMERRRSAWQAKEHHEEAAKAEANKYPAEYKPVNLPDIQEIMRRYDSAQATVRKLENVRHALEVAGETENSAQEMLDELRQRIKAAELRYEEARQIRQDLQDELASAKDAAVDPAPIKLELADYEKNKAWHNAWEAAEDHVEQRDLAAAEVRDYDAAVQRGIRIEAPALLWSRLEGTPLGGLAIAMEQDRITVGGVDIDNLSQSEQVRLALAVARATCGELKVIGMDGIESLDADSLAEFHRQAATDGFQYVVCQVSEGPLRVE